MEEHEFLRSQHRSVYMICLYFYFDAKSKICDKTTKPPPPKEISQKAYFSNFVILEKLDLDAKNEPQDYS